MKQIKFATVLVLVIALFSACNKTGKQGATNADVEIKTTLDSVAYAIGASVGGNLKREGVTEINDAAIAKGVREMLKGENVLMDDKMANKFLQEYFSELKNKKFEKNIELSKQFLEENSKKEGVVTLESGLQYKIIKEGNGPKPAVTDNVKVHYHGTLIDGTVFDSSVDRGEPISFALNRVIKGWTEGLQLMPVGSKWIFYIPSDLAYGKNPRPGGVIEPNMALIFEVELLGIEDAEEKTK